MYGTSVYGYIIRMLILPLSRRFAALCKCRRSNVEVVSDNFRSQTAFAEVGMASSSPIKCFPSTFSEYNVFKCVQSMHVFVCWCFIFNILLSIFIYLVYRTLFGIVVVILRSTAGNNFENFYGRSTRLALKNSMIS